MRSRMGWLVFVALVCVLSACQADVVVDFDVKRDGSGTVDVALELDANAASALGATPGEPFSDFLFGDLVAAGWDVSAPTLLPDGGLVTQMTKEVPTADDWQAVVDEIAGPGVFVDFLIDRQSTFARKTHTVSFDIDLRRGWGLLSDADLANALDGEPFGVSIDALTEGRPIDEIIAVAVRTTVESDGETLTLTTEETPRFDAAEPLEVVVTSRFENATAVLLRWIAIALSVLAALAFVLALVGTRLQRRSDRLRPQSKTSSDTTNATSASSTVAASEESAPDIVATSTSAGPIETEPPDVSNREPVRLLVIEPRTVLYGGGSIEDEMIPFVRHYHGMGITDEISDRYNKLLVGRAEPDGYWEVCRISQPTDSINQRYLATRQLRPGAAEFLADMQRRRIPVAAVTNDAATWSERTRERDRLSVIWPWVVSANVGVTKSDGSMFELLKRESGVEFRHCLFVDTDVASLDAAAALGMRTALLARGVQPSQPTGHPVIADLADLFH